MRRDVETVVSVEPIEHFEPQRSSRQSSRRGRALRDVVAAGREPADRN
jgi:hypothetical protein